MDKTSDEITEEELKKAWREGEISITPEQIKTLVDTLDKSYEKWFNESLQTLCAETGKQIDITWEEAKKYITLNDLKGKYHFNDLMKFIEEIRTQEEQSEESQSTIQQQIVPQTQLQEITRAVMLMNYDIEEGSGQFCEKYYIDPDNKDLGYITLSLVNAKGEPLILLPYERSVASALWSYFRKAGTERGFSYKDITRFILHRERVSKESVQDVKGVIQRFRHIDVEIDYKTHVKAKYTTNIIRRYLAPVDEVTIKHSNGYVEEGIRFIATPPLFQFADDTGGILSTETKYLDIPLNMHLKTDVPIRDYLLRRINQRQRGNEKQNKILLSSIMEKCGQKPYEELTRTEKKRLRERIEVMLSTWTEQGKIARYRPYKTGKEITGYYIYTEFEEGRND